MMSYIHHDHLILCTHKDVVVHTNSSVAAFVQLGFLAQVQEETQLVEQQLPPQSSTVHKMACWFTDCEPVDRVSLSSAHSILQVLSMYACE